jgi:hypothetical protein
MIFESKSERRANLGVNVAQNTAGISHASVVPAQRESRPREMIPGEKFSHYSCSAPLLRAAFGNRSSSLSATDYFRVIYWLHRSIKNTADYILIMFTIRMDNRG